METTELEIADAFCNKFMSSQKDYKIDNDKDFCKRTTKQLQCIYKKNMCMSSTTLKRHVFRLNPIQSYDSIHAV